MSGALLLAGEGIRQQRSGVFQDTLVINSLANYQKMLFNGTNSTVTYTSGPPPAFVAPSGATSARSAYALSGKRSVATDLTLYVRVFFAATANWPFAGVLFDPVTGWWALFGVGFAAGSFFMQLRTVSPVSPFNEVGVQDDKVGLFAVPAATEYWVKLQKVATLLTCGIYNADPRSGGALIDPDATSTFTLTGSAAAALGTGRKVAPGFQIGPQSQLRGIALDCAVEPYP